MSEFEIDTNNNIDIKPKKGRPKKVQKKEVNVDPIIDLNGTMSCSSDDDEDFMDFMGGMVTDDERTQLKKLFLTNKKLLGHLTIKKIDMMDDDDLIEALNMSRLLISTEVNTTLTSQLMSAVNTTVSYLFGLGSDFDKVVQQDDNIMKISNEILNSDVLCHLNHRLQFLLLYGSKLVTYNSNKKDILELEAQDEFNRRLEAINKQKEYVLPESEIPKNREDVEV